MGWEKRSGMAPPRVVVVRRPTALEGLLARHGSPGQARFFLQSRGQKFEDVEAVHTRFMTAFRVVCDGIPPQWRVVRLERKELSRFTFEPGDVVVVVGPDGLVANVAKYLDGQRVVGINPDPAQYDGVLVPHPPSAASKLMQDAMRGVGPLSPRTLVEARLDDGQVLRALNEIFVGHISHQSARYVLTVGGKSERHSSSGLLVSSGTGATGWARSIMRAWRLPEEGPVASKISKVATSVGTATHTVTAAVAEFAKTLGAQAEGAAPLVQPKPGDPAVLFLVREAFPSVRTGTDLTSGLLSGAGTTLSVLSELDEGGVIFGDGIEEDRLAFGWGRTVKVGPCAQQLMWVG